MIFLHQIQLLLGICYPIMICISVLQSGGDDSKACNNQLIMLAYISLAIAALFLVLFLLRRKPTTPSCEPAKPVEAVAKVEEKTGFGRVRIYFGTQTGTAAKLAEQLGEEATENGFEPDIVDLKDVTSGHFSTVNEVSLFLVSNTGEGDPPENTVRFLKALKGKEEQEGLINIGWQRVNYGIFGLGNTQYEHFNKTAIDLDALLEKNAAKRIYKTGLGDDNCSLEDDFTEWRKDLWKTLKQFRQENPLKDGPHEEKAVHKGNVIHEPHVFLSKQEPVLANYRLFIKRGKEEEYAWVEDDLDFKTKAALKAESATVKNLKQLRQDEKDGSTLELQVELPGSPEYHTAGNIALYSKNDPSIIKEVLEYFQIPVEALDEKVGLLKVKEDKKMKLNFLPNTLRTLLEESVDLQGKLSKSVLKKLAKFPSKNPEYFSQNSLKTTKEFERITSEEEWYYLIRIIREFQVKLALEDFLELSDSMAPRLFTIASHAGTHRNVAVAASIVPRGLISKYFVNSPSSLKGELRKSTFTPMDKWKKVILVGAGTGVAPFIGFCQEKEYCLRLQKEGKVAPTPIITLVFGCKHETGDFIYKQELLRWKENGVIDRLHLAFSRDTDKKVYVQDVLAREEAEVKELGHCEETAIYICGSLPMGKAIVDLLTHVLGAQKVQAMEVGGRIIKELW